MVGGTGGTGGSAGTGGTGGTAGTVGGTSGTGGTGAGGVGGTGTVVTPTEPADRAQERSTLDEELSALAGLDGAGLRERFPTSFEPAPTYEPSAIAGLSTIQASSLALTPAELQALSQKGFVVSGGRTFPTFAYGYSTIYLEDLPVYISADSILTSVHASYDRVLEELEVTSLMGELSALLSGMRSRLKSGVGAELGDAVRADADVFLAVAAGLLDGSSLEPVAGGSSQAIDDLVARATEANGIATVTLFGVAREDEDFSQFMPRGHYTDSEALGRYFRAMMWLGRIDFRLFETQEDGTQLFRRRQLEGMLLMNELIDSELREHFERIDRAVRVFVGEPDYMELSEVAPLLADVGISSLADVAGVSDQAFAQAIFDGGYGLQRISSHIMINGLDEPGTLPLSLSFALLGQRYVIDSHVFSNVVYDRAGKGTIARVMPNPLDVGFAALGNDQAAELLAPELQAHPYAPDLAAMRVLVDRHPPEFWSENLYNLWLGALRELSPARIAASADASALPPTFRSEAWGRRLLVTGLASWAELRHDTLLYAKQSYTGGFSCEFPDGYVDPYPEFYQKLVDYAARGKETVVAVAAGTSVAARAESYFDNLAMVAGRLRDMAAHQRTGAAYTQEMLDFLNDAVVVDPGCGDPFFESGWYHQLFYEPHDGVVWSPTIADVHTQPTDEAGNFVGRVLHVGTGDARYMVVVADTCSGPRAYAGLASSYHERITENFERLDDPTWETTVRAEPDVPWAAGLVTR
jgi:hypothetical protein